jgi:hypothetical protein
MNNQSVLEIDQYGTKRWTLNGLFHREDGPAVEHSDGTKYWCLNGLYHRKDGPAVENIYGYKAWWLNGERHRIDGPAVEYTDGTKAWIICGLNYSQDEWFKRLTPEQQNNYLWSLDE